MKKKWKMESRVWPTERTENKNLLTSEFVYLWVFRLKIRVQVVFTTSRLTRFVLQNIVVSRIVLSTRRRGLTLPWWWMLYRLVFDFNIRVWLKCLFEAIITMLVCRGLNVFWPRDLGFDGCTADGSRTGQVLTIAWVMNLGTWDKNRNWSLCVTFIKLTVLSWTSRLKQRYQTTTNLFCGYLV